MKLLIIFIVANIINVVIQTIKSICTINCGKWTAAWVNALAYGFYTYIVILMSADLPLLSKCIIIGLCNLIGVYVVKFFEEKSFDELAFEMKMTSSELNSLLTILERQGIIRQSAGKMYRALV